MKKMFLLFWAMTITVLACNNSNSETPRAAAAATAVDSATNAASDTIRPSSDTTAIKSPARKMDSL